MKKIAELPPSLRTADDVFCDTMHLCGLLNGVYMAKG